MVTIVTFWASLFFLVPMMVACQATRDRANAHRDHAGPQDDRNPWNWVFLRWRRFKSRCHRLITFANRGHAPGVDIGNTAVTIYDFRVPPRPSHALIAISRESFVRYGLIPLPMINRHWRLY